MSDRHDSSVSAPPLTSSTGAPLADHLDSITRNADCCPQQDDKEDPIQLGIFFRLMPPEARRRLFGSIADRMAKAPQETRLRVICRLFRADPNYGIGVAQALGLALNNASSFTAGLVKA